MSEQPRPERSLRSRRGQSIIEFTLLLPWYFFLFVGAYDFAFYSYSLIALEEGVRTAALNASASTSAAGNSCAAFTYVLGALQDLPNMSGATCSPAAGPLTVTATYGNGTGPDSASETTVTAIYISPQLIPIPGFLPGQLTITRSVQMRLRI